MLKSYTIYTDGSDLKRTTHRMGIGGILVDDNYNILDKFSIELNREDILKNYKTQDCSNPFAEMMAIKNALEIFSESIESPAKITIKCDYEGCIKWLSGEWRAKAFYIAQVKEEIETIIKQKKNWEIEFKWVKGHQSIMDNDSYFNNLVDKLAKGI